MVRGSDTRQTSHAIDSIFVDRWSPRAMSGAAIPLPELMLLFEVARWAPSSMNHQPWRMLYALRDTPHWPLFLGLLHEGNRRWAQQGGALVLFISKKNLRRRPTERDTRVRYRRSLGEFRAAGLGARSGGARHAGLRLPTGAHRACDSAQL
jgi:nitroreductase